MAGVGFCFTESRRMGNILILWNSAINLIGLMAEFLDVFIFMDFVYWDRFVVYIGLHVGF